VKAPIAVERLKQLYDGLKTINKAEEQTIVPEALPNALSVDDIKGFQKALLDYFDAKPLAALKTFMMAAAENLKEEGDGLVYYLFFAGLPGFIFGRPESQKNSIRSVTSVCPLPRYGHCIVTRPLPPGEVDGPCGDISNP
jgi:hypothetical protein